MPLSDREQAIAAVQSALKEAGHYAYEIDGDLGPKTLASIKAFQDANSIPITGRLNPATIEKLGVGVGPNNALADVMSA